MDRTDYAKNKFVCTKNDVNEAKAEMRVEADGMISEALKSYVTSDDFGDYKTETKTRFEQTDNQFGFMYKKIHMTG
mgnify:CR=1 FL=1